MFGSNIFVTTMERHVLLLQIPCPGTIDRGNCAMIGRGPNPVRTFFKVAIGGGAGDWAGDTAGLLSCGLFCLKKKVNITFNQMLKYFEVI